MAAVAEEDLSPIVAALHGGLGEPARFDPAAAAAPVRGGAASTPLSERLFSDPHWVATVVNRVPMGRVGATDDLAGIAVFLASDAAAYVTGQNVNIDGGLSTGV